MTARPVPSRHWRSYGDDPLPTGREALAEPFSAFPSWHLRITCDRCGKDRDDERGPHAAPRGHRPDASRRLRRQGRKVELLTGIDGSSRPVRRIVVRAD